MKLNIHAQIAQNQHNNSPIVLAHGLFGNLDNLGVLARDLVDNHNIIQVDMCNHGLSSRDSVMNYPAMVQDLVDTLDAQQIDKATFTSHPMGDRAVMTLTALAPGHIDKLAAIDIAPVNYRVCRHDEIFMAINAVSESDAQTRQRAAAIMRQHLNEEGVIQFPLKSFVDGEWYLNMSVLWDQYPHTVGWEKIPAWNHPVLFIPDGNSSYVNEQYRDDLLVQLPQAWVHATAGASHWVHAEKPDAALRATRRYLND